MPATPRVLILTDEPVIAALIGILVEIGGRTPVFANPDETPSDAVRRLRPLAVVLVDASMPAAQSDIFFAVTNRYGIGAAVFAPEGRPRNIAEIAAAREIPWVTLPPTADELSSAIEIASGRQKSVRAEDRRAPPETIVASDGTRILRDRAGRRWMVYDRRSRTDRRSAAPGEVTTRVFVSEAGELRQCGLGDAELDEASASVLESQLERAT